MGERVVPEQARNHLREFLDANLATRSAKYGDKFVAYCDIMEKLVRLKLKPPREKNVEAERRRRLQDESNEAGFTREEWVGMSNTAKALYKGWMGLGTLRTFRGQDPHIILGDKSHRQQ